MKKETSFIIILFFFMSLSTTEIYSQNAQSLDDLTKYNRIVKQVFWSIVNNKIRGPKAEFEVKKLQDSLNSNNKVYSKLVHQILPEIIFYQSKDEQGTARNFIRQGEELIREADQKINDMTDTFKNETGKQVKETLQNVIRSDNEINTTENDSANMQSIPDAENLGLGDLVIDHTQSKWGKDFVDLFNKSWNPPANISSYTIIIEEKPLPRFGTVILIKVNGNYIYQKFIQPRYETIELNAEQGSQLVLSYLENYRQTQKDLQGDDMKGTGIY